MRAARCARPSPPSSSENGEVARATMHLADHRRAHHGQPSTTRCSAPRAPRSSRDRDRAVRRVQHAEAGLGPGQEHLRGDRLRGLRRAEVIRASTTFSSSTATTAARARWRRRSRARPTASTHAVPQRGPGARGGSLDPRMVAFMEGARLRHDCKRAERRSPTSWRTSIDTIVIVGLDGPVKSCVPRMSRSTRPPSTWDVGIGRRRRPARKTTARQLESIYRDLAVRIDDLMQVLSGSGEAWMATTTGETGSPLPPVTRAASDRPNLDWYIDKAVQALVFLGGVSAIVFILGIFVFITREGMGFILGELDFREFFTSPRWRPTSEWKTDVRDPRPHRRAPRASPALPWSWRFPSPSERRSTSRSSPPARPGRRSRCSWSCWPRSRRWSGGSSDWPS